MVFYAGYKVLPLGDGHRGEDAACFEGKFVYALSGVAERSWELIAAKATIEICDVAGQANHIGIIPDELIKVLIGAGTGRAVFAGE